MLKILIVFNLFLSGCTCQCQICEKDSALLTNTYQTQLEDREQEIRNLTNSIQRLSKDVEYWQGVGDEWRDKYFSQNCIIQSE